MDDRSLFSFRLRHAREERGMSQAALASGICSASAVSRWEAGQSVPTSTVIMQLADRLGLPAELLVHRDFDSRLLAAGDGFGDLITASLDGVPDPGAASPMASWIARARYVLDGADRWSGGPDPRPVIDDLAVDPLTTSVPVALETVELLDAMVRVRETADRVAVDALTDTLTGAADAPAAVRRTALETVVAMLVSAGMPVAARSAVTRVAPPEITATTAALLTWDGFPRLPPADLPPVTASRSARDAAFDVLARLRDAPVEVRRAVTDTVAAAFPDDGLVAWWAHRL